MSSEQPRTVNRVEATVIPIRETAVNSFRITLVLAQKERCISSGYLTGDYVLPKPRKTKMTCEIDDNEARAVQRLVLDLQGQSEVLDDWMDAIIGRYFYSSSWSEMVTDERSQLDARMDVKCGLAALHSRYGFIEYV